MARIERVKELLLQYPDAFWTNQYENPDNPDSYYYGLAKEIDRDLDGNIDCLFAPVSTSGLITGCARYFKERNAAVQIIAVDAEGSTIFGGVSKPRKMTGIGGNLVPVHLKMDHIDRVYHVSDQDSYLMCRQIVNQESMLVGPSSGASLHAVMSYMESCEVTDRPWNVVVIFPDNGERYLSGFLSGLTEPAAQEREVLI